MHYWVDIQKSRLSEIMNDGLLMWKKFTHWKVTWHKRCMSTSPCTKYSSYWSYWVAFFYMLEDTLIFLFDCLFLRRRKRKSSFKLMRGKHRCLHQRQDPKSDTPDETGAGEDTQQRSAELEEWHEPVEQSLLPSNPLGCRKEDTCSSYWGFFLIFYHQHPFPPSTKAMKENE